VFVAEKNYTTKGPESSQQCAVRGLLDVDELDKRSLRVVLASLG
jgi:hypothetical protein